MRAFRSNSPVTSVKLFWRVVQQTLLLEVRETASEWLGGSPKGLAQNHSGPSFFRYILVQNHFRSLLFRRGLVQNHSGSSSSRWGLVQNHSGPSSSRWGLVQTHMYWSISLQVRLVQNHTGPSAFRWGLVQNHSGPSSFGKDWTRTILLSSSFR